MYGVTRMAVADTRSGKAIRDALMRATDSGRPQVIGDDGGLRMDNQPSGVRVLLPFSLQWRG